MTDLFLILLIILLILFFLAKILWLFLGNEYLRRPYHEENNEDKETGDLIGKSNFELRQSMANEDLSGQKNKPVNQQVIFAGENPAGQDLERIDAEFEIEYPEQSGEDIENEGIYFDDDNTAQGFTYDELENVLQVTRKEDAGEDEKRLAVQTIQNLGEDLLKTITESFGISEQKVAGLFQEFNNPGASKEVTNDISSFDINDYVRV